jgi:hypothetical protein
MTGGNMAQAQSLKDLMKIRQHFRSFFDSINGNLGTALGFKKTTGQPISEKPAIIVFVPMKINPKWIPGAQVIPKKLETPDGLWCPVDVVEGSKAEVEKDVPQAEGELLEKLRGWDDKIWGGSQISHWVNQQQGSYSLGTLGAFAKRGNVNGFLTNQHVGIEPGKKIFHPVPWGTHSGTTEEVIEYAEDQNWYGSFSDEPHTYVRVDCAFVRLEDAVSGDLNTELMALGKINGLENISLDDMSVIGKKVKRVGRTTGVREGTIWGFGYEYSDDNEFTLYTDLLIIGDDGIPFSTHGDSGSLIVTAEDNRGIGLLWGGWQEKLRTGYAQENWTYGIALDRVLTALNIELITE